MICLCTVYDLSCTAMSVISSLVPERYCSTRVQGPVPDTSRGTTVRAGQTLLPHTDESSTRLHGGRDSTLQGKVRIVGTECCSFRLLCVFKTKNFFLTGSLMYLIYTHSTQGVGVGIYTKKKRNHSFRIRHTTSSPERMCPPTVAAFSMTQTLNSSLPAWNRDKNI
jgi:hypothetical protein